MPIFGKISYQIKQFSIQELDFDWSIYIVAICYRGSSIFLKKKEHVQNFSSISQKLRDEFAVVPSQKILDFLF